MKIITKQGKLISDQKGLASFLITLIMTIVISLIVLGFSQIARNEQLSSLNRQLSTQAFYAAESGINDAINAIQTYQAQNAAASPPDKTSCGPDTNYPSLDGSINAQSNVSYSCLLISSTPSTLLYTGSTSKVVNIQTNGGATFSTINISWQDSGLNSNLQFNCDAVGVFPGSQQSPQGWPANCDADVLQVDLVPGTSLISNSGSNVLNAVESSTFTTFLYPTNNATPGIVNDQNSAQGVVESAGCTNNFCNEQINVSSLSQTQLIMRWSAMYGIPQNVSISATDVSGKTVNFIDDQALIDSTGKDQGELKRIEVRVPLNNLNSGLFPTAAIQSTDSICKRFYITNSGTSSTGNNPNPGEPNQPGSNCITSQ